MAPKTPRTDKKSSGDAGRGSTKQDASGQVLPVTNPLDLWYLCEKARYAKAKPYRRSSDQAPLYQRAVAKWILLENAAVRYSWPYCAEVGYNMTKKIPTPVMSIKEDYRPSTFPLSQYKLISSRVLPQYRSVEVAVDILSKNELEQMIALPLSSNVDEGIWLDVQGGQKGLLRIPDVVRVIDHTLGGEPQWSRGNLASVIEMKFGNDALTDEQQKAYERIAGSKFKFRLLHTDRCDKADRRQRREWMTAAQKEPVYQPVASGFLPLPLRPSADPHGLLVGLIDAEHQAAREALEIKPLPSGTPMMSASPDTRQADAQAQRARAQIELSLMAPFVAVGSIGIGAGMATVGGGGAVSGSVLTARAGPQVVRYSRLIDWVRLAGGIGAVGTGAAVAYAKSEDGSSSPVLTQDQQRMLEAYQAWEASQRYQPRTEQLYLFWPDAPGSKQ